MRFDQHVIALDNTCRDMKSWTPDCIWYGSPGVIIGLTGICSVARRELLAKRMSEASRSILVYERLDISVIQYVCHQMGISVNITSDAAEAAVHIGNSDFAAALVGLELDPVYCPEELPVIAIGSPSASMSERIAHYKPCRLLPRPVLLERLQAVIEESVYGISNPSLPCRLESEICALQDLAFRLDCFLLEKRNHLDLNEMARMFCVTECPLSVPPSKIIAARSDEYEAITVDNIRGPLYCRFKKSCRLLNASDKARKIAPELLSATPASCIEEPSPCHSFTSSISASIESCRGLLCSFFNFRDRHCKCYCNSDPSNRETVTSMCCESSCVLDYFYSVTYLVKTQRKGIVLLLAPSSTDAKVLASCCNETGLDVEQVSAARDAESVLQCKDVVLVIAESSLLPVGVPAGVPLLVFGNKTSANLMEIVRHKPDAFLLRPVSEAHAALSLARILDVFSSGNSSLSALSNLLGILEPFSRELMSWQKDETRAFSLWESIDAACSASCEHFVEFEAAVETDGIGELAVIGGGKDGKIYACNDGASCQLRKFKMWLHACKGYVTQSALGAVMADTNGPLALQSVLPSVVNEMEKQLIALNQARLEYCREFCEYNKKGTGFSEGCHVFGDFFPSSQNVEVRYCSIARCPLDNFFEYFKRTVL